MSGVLQDGGVEALSETGSLHVSAQCVCQSLNMSILQDATFQFRCDAISRVQMEFLFGEDRCDAYYKWLPGAASHFQAVLQNFRMSVVKLPRLCADVLVTQPSPLFHVVSGGHIVTHASLVASMDGRDVTYLDTRVYVLPSSTRISEPSLVFMPSEWLQNQRVEEAFLHAIRTSAAGSTLTT